MYSICERQTNNQLSVFLICVHLYQFICCLVLLTDNVIIIAMPSQNFNLTFSLLLCPIIKVQGRSNPKQFAFLK